MDAETRDLLRASIRELLERSDTDLVAALDELGWQDAVADDPAGAVDLLFTEQGMAGRGSAALDAVLVDAAGGELPEVPLTVVHPLGAASCTECDEQVRVDGVALSAPRSTRGYLIATSCAGSCVHVVQPDRLTCVTEAIRGFDPASSLHRVRFDLSIADARKRKCDWTAAVAAARRALAAELVGNGRAMLDIAVDHVRQREQFGRPIGVNQTPRHRLAESYTRLAAARELIDVAWKTGTAWDAWLAKTYAGFASETTSRACLQVCGAIGLTSEHSLGGYVKRARVIEALYTGWRVSVQDIGVSLLRSEAIPVGPRV